MDPDDALRRQLMARWGAPMWDTIIGYGMWIGSFAAGAGLHALVVWLTAR